MRVLLQDARYGLRMLARNRTFTAVALITLVLGIGANSGLYTVTRNLVVEPFSFPDGDDLVVIWSSRTSGDSQPFTPRARVDAFDFLEWRGQASAFTELALYRQTGQILVGGGEPERVQVVQSTAGLLPMLGFGARLGRLHSGEEDSLGSTPVVLLTDGMWRRRFGGDPGVLGQSIKLDDVPHTIIGVLPPEVNGADLWDDADLWSPLRIDPARIHRGDRVFMAMARLKPGVTLGQSQIEMSALAAGLAEAHPDTNAGWGVAVEPLDSLLQPMAEEVFAYRGILAAVGFVLVIACLNLANLFLARTWTRKTEFAVRAALGASRFRIIRQLLTESAVLAVIGGGLGMLLGQWGLDYLAASMDQELLRREGLDLSLDPSVILYMLGLSFLAALAFALGPALQTARRPVHEGLKEGGPTASRAPARRRVGNAFIVGQIMVVLPLLVCCGLAIKTTIALGLVDLGFNPDRILTAGVALPEHRYPEASQQAAFFERLLAAVEALPGAQSAALASDVPFSLSSTNRAFVLEDRPPADGEERLVVRAKSISPGYFQVLETGLVAGRFLSEQDRAGAERVVLVNQRMAERYWPDESAIGRQLRLGGDPADGPWRTIVGIVEDSYQLGVKQPPDPEMYLPFQQVPVRGMTILLKTPGEPLEFAGSLRAAVARLDPDQPVHEVSTLWFYVNRLIGDFDVTAKALGGFALVAMSLAAVGLLGVMSISVARRTREIGVRVALGATPGDVMRVVLGNALTLVAVGLAVGLMMSLAAAHVLSSKFYGVSPTDPLIYIASAVLLAAVGFVACYVPARRALKIHPLEALHHE